MAQLTWRNVDAPDFRTSLEGYETFSRLLGDAFRGAKEGIATFDASQNEKANTAVIAAAMRERDPEAYQAALASGEFIEGVDPRRISAQTYANLNNQASSLLNQATQTQQLGDMKYASDKGKAFDQLGDEYQQIESLRRIGTPEANAEADQLVASLRPQLAAAGTQNTMSLLKGFNDAEAFGVGITGQRQEQKLALNRDARDETRLGYEGREQNRADARLNMDEGRYNWEVSDRNDVKSGQAAFMAMQGRSMDRETALSAFNSPEFANLTPGAKMYALQQLNASWGNIYTQEQLGTAAGFSGSGSSWAQQVGLVSSESKGNWSALNDEGYGGRLQFGDARLADAAKAGVIPKGITGVQFAKLPKEVQMKVENWHFQDIDAQANRLGVTKYIGKTVAGVPINKDSIRGMAHLGGIQGVKKFIESNGQYDPSDSNGTKLSDYGRKFGSGSPTKALATIGIQEGRSRMGNTTSSALIEAAVNETGNIGDTISSLQSDAFKGVSYNFLNDELEKIVANGEGKITYSQAGVILRNSLKDPSKLIPYSKEQTDSSWFTFRRYNRSSVFNDERIKADTKKAKSDDLWKGLDFEEKNEAKASILKTAMNNYNQALNQVVSAQKANAAGQKVDMVRMQAKLDQATAALAKAKSFAKE